MTVTAIIGGGYGSEGKGVVAAAMAKDYDMAIRTGGPNAGHSFYFNDVKHVMRSVPCAWINPDCALVIGPGAVVNAALLIEEQARTGRVVWLDWSAALIPHEAEEAERVALVDRVGSTAEGVGYTRKLRIDRNPETLTLAGDHEWPDGINVIDTVEMTSVMLNAGGRLMLEGTQGSGLSLYHGPWPYATSADCNVAGFLSEAGVAPRWLEHTILVVRTYPIRVGGNSGPMYHEIKWSDVPGAPEPERTTVTKRIRRIGMWDAPEFERAIDLNRPCGVVLTFMDYVDPSIAGTTNAADIAASSAAREFVNKVESFGVPVIAAGTGGPRWSLARLEVCQHGEALV